MTSRIPHHIEAELRARAEQRENRRAVDLSQYTPIAFGPDGVQRELTPEERRGGNRFQLNVVPPRTERAEEDRLLAAVAVALLVGALVGCAGTVAVMGIL